MRCSCFNSSIYSVLFSHFTPPFISAYNHEFYFLTVLHLLSILPSLLPFLPPLLTLSLCYPHTLPCMSVSGGDASPLWRAAEYIKVFARMSPQGKAAVIRAIQKGSPSESGGGESRHDVVLSRCTYRVT